MLRDEGNWVRKAVVLGIALCMHLLKHWQECYLRIKSISLWERELHFFLFKQKVTKIIIILISSLSPM